MLAFHVGRGDLDLSEVAPYLLEQARERKGQWEIVVYDSEGESHAARFTEEEYSKLSRTMYHGLRNGTKTSAFHAGLENAAQTLWPTGSLDHVAMRHVGVMFVMAYITRATGQSQRKKPYLKMGAVVIGALCTRELHLVLMALVVIAHMYYRARGWQVMLPSLNRVESRAERKPAQKEANEGNESNDTGPEHKPTPPKLDAPSTPNDDENGAEATEDGRTIVRGDVVAVVGQNYDKDEPVNHMPIVGLLVGPCQLKPNVYSKTASNIKAAIQQRIVKKAIKPNLNKIDKARIGGLVRKCMSVHKRCGVFSRERVREWACQHFNLEDCKSGKWSLARFRGSLENLYAKERPRYSFKTDIKYECMPEGKAPRMLIADGDEGQLMALAVVKCFEELLFEHFEAKSIKHLAKRDAIHRVLGELHKPGAKAIEGDGSAWDTTCNVLIRSLVENPILRHIFEVLSEFGVIPECWMEEHSLACEQKRLRLFFSNKFETISVTIDAIRRSGHRGTSCLNWWINFVMWVSSVFKEPERFLDPDVRKGEDLVGVMRWWNGCFEGDDSLCTMKPPMEEGDALSDVFLKFWKSAGFDMKIVFCDKRATFVGWHLGCTDGELNEVCCPELPRALANSGVSVSTEGIQAAKDANRKTANTLAAASALARASDFSGILPSVSNKYLDFAESLNTADFQDREMSIRAFGDDGFGAKAVREQIRERNMGVTPQEEMKIMEVLGYDATHGEIATFQEYVWSMDPHVLTDYDSFRESLPPSWRKS